MRTLLLLAFFGTTLVAQVAGSLAVNNKDVAVDVCALSNWEGVTLSPGCTLGYDSKEKSSWGFVYALAGIQISKENKVLMSFGPKIGVVAEGYVSIGLRYQIAVCPTEKFRYGAFLDMNLAKNASSALKGFVFAGWVF